MGLTLLISTILIRLIVGVLHSRMWVSYVAVLILLGGLLVIFIYISLLASNETFTSNKFAPPLILRILTTILLAVLNPFIREPLLNSNNNITRNINKKRLEWLSDFYSSELSSLTLFLIFYLLLTLLVVVFNTKNNHGTLRSNS